MGIIRSTFRFSNPVRTDLQPIDVNCLVDTGAVHLRLPEHTAIQLDLKELERREVTVADGRRLSVPYCGPIQIRLKNRNSVDLKPQSANVPQSLVK